MLPVVIVLAIITCLLVLFTCIACLRRYQHARRQNLDQKGSILVTHKFSRVVPAERGFMDEESRNMSFTGFDIVTHEEQIDKAQLLPLDCSIVNDENHNELPLKNMLDYSSTIAKEHSTPSSNILNTSLAIGQAKVKYCVKYVKSNSTLLFTLQEVVYLQERYRSKAIYAVVNLFPEQTNNFTSRLIVYEDSGIFNETFKFKRISPKALEKSTIKVSIHFKKSKRRSKDEFLGQTFLVCSSIDWNSLAAVQCQAKLQQEQCRKVSTCSKYLLKDLGELFILLQYHEAAHRIKVLVIKAHNLPKADTFMDQPSKLHLKLNYY